MSEERINKVGETYRGIRNALRYQLSNLFDFDPVKHSVPDDKLTGLDRWILGEFSKLEAEVMGDNGAYYNYEFHVVYKKLSQFIAVELSSIYHDVIKDRLYTDAANSPRRRSTQTALHRLVTGLCRMLAPILAFTADEAWEFISGKPTGSVHEAQWANTRFNLPNSEQVIWKTLFSLREAALPKLEEKRKTKLIGKSLDAHVYSIFAPNFESQATIAIVQKHQAELKELLNVSQFSFKHDTSRKLESGTSEFEGKISIDVFTAQGQKCERCWHWETDIGTNPEHPTICGRCVEAVKQSKA